MKNSPTAANFSASVRSVATLRDGSFVALTTGGEIKRWDPRSGGAHRIPLRESIVWPASHCTTCNRQLAWYENIPLASWLAAHGLTRGLASYWQANSTTVASGGHVVVSAVVPVVGGRLVPYLWESDVSSYDPARNFANFVVANGPGAWPGMQPSAQLTFGRPVRIYMEMLGPLIEASSVGGGSFELGSASFDMTRVLTGQLDAYIEPGPRIIGELPATRSEFERVGGGAVLNNTPYDLAAATLCLEEGGAIVTDAAGRSLADRPLLGSGPEHQMSVVASASPRLHARLIEELDAGIERVAFSLAGAQETESR